MKWVDCNVNKCKLMKEKCEMAMQKRFSPGGESGVTKRWDRTGMGVVALTSDQSQKYVIPPLLNA